MSERGGFGRRRSPRGEPDLGSPFSGFVGLSPRDARNETNTISPVYDVGHRSSERLSTRRNRHRDGGGGELMFLHKAIIFLAFLWGILTILHTAVLAVTVLPDLVT